MARTLLRALTPARWREELDGDLLEGFNSRHREMGGWRARRWYWRQLISPDVLRLRRVGRPSRAAERVHRDRGWPGMMVDELAQDLRFAARSIRKSPMFAAVVVGTLALGIGANTAIFSVVNGVLLRPLPYESPEELAMIFRTVPRFGFERSTASYPDFADWRAESRSFSSLAAYGYTTATHLTGDGADRWTGYRVTAELFPLLGVPAASGRVFTPDDDRPDAVPVIVLSHRAWQSRFGGDPDLIGGTITLDRELVTVVGVMPPGFAFPSRSTEFWTPLRGDPNRLERDSNFLTVIGRLAPGSTIETAGVEMVSLAARIDESAEGANEGYGIFVEGRHAFEVRNARTALWVFLGAVTLVLLVACANVANLLLTRGTTRRREIAVRSAIGAGPGRLARQLLTESLVLASLGGILGIFLAFALLRALVALGPSGLPRLETVGLDSGVLAVALALSVACGLVFGAAPAVLGARSEASDSLKDGALAAGTGRWTRRLQHGFATAQVAVAIALMIGAGLLVNSFVRLTSVEPGFEPTGVVAARVMLPRPEPPLPPTAESGSREERMSLLMEQRRSWTVERDGFYGELQRRVAGLPGVASVGLAYGLPFSGSSFSRVVFPEGLEVIEGEAPVVAGNVIHGDYLRTMGISLMEGRGFTDADLLDAPSVALVNETMARTFWPDESPLGKRLRFGSGEGPWTTVVGVVVDVQRRSLADDRQPIYYRPFAQTEWVEGMYLTVQTGGDIGEVVPMLRRAVWDLNPELPLTDIAAVADLIDDSVAAPRFRTLVLGTFGVIAAIIALVGIYGVIAFAVGERTREIGVRLALGARPEKIRRMVLAGGLRLAVLGTILGVVAALALTRFLSGMLFGLTAHDPLTFVLAALAILATVALACWLPARRASRVDPLESLRCE